MSSGGVSIVVQRFRECKLLIDELEYVTVGGNGESCGLLAYISFASSTTLEQVELAATTLLNLPVLTTGLWGDGESSTCSVLELAANPSSSCSLVVVPQANLISKVKQQGKSIQYHGQVKKEKGEELYNSFCDLVRGKLLEEKCSTRKEDLPRWYIDRRAALVAKQNNNSQPSCVSKPPEQLFRVESKYSEWDEKGIPTKDVEGNELSKSQLKKLNKIYEAHRKRHAKWKENGAVAPTFMDEMNDKVPEARWEESLGSSFCHFIAGSFGCRQGLTFKSDMGPFVVSTSCLFVFRSDLQINSAKILCMIFS